VQDNITTWFYQKRTVVGYWRNQGSIPLTLYHAYEYVSTPPSNLLPPFCCPQLQLSLQIWPVAGSIKFHGIATTDILKTSWRKIGTAKPTEEITDIRKH
jgi:hypothetical protein